MKTLLALFSFFSFSTYAQLISYTPEQLLYDMTYGRYTNCSVLPNDVFFQIEVNGHLADDLYYSKNRDEMKNLMAQVESLVSNGTCKRDEREFLALIDYSSEQMLEDVKDKVYGNCSLSNDDRYTYIWVDGQMKAKHFSYELNKISTFLRIAISKRLCKRGLSESDQVYEDVLNNNYQNCSIFKVDGMTEFYVDGKMAGNYFPFQVNDFKVQLSNLASNNTCLILDESPLQSAPDSIEKIFNDMRNGHYQNCSISENSRQETTFVINSEIKNVYSKREIKALKLYLRSLVIKKLCAKK